MLLGFMSMCLFSSRSFIILGFAFRYLIHFEFFFFPCICVKDYPNFVLLPVAVHYSQQLLLKRLSSLLCCNWLTISVWAYFWAYWPFALISVCVCLCQIFGSVTWTMLIEWKRRTWLSWVEIITGCKVTADSSLKNFFLGIKE